MVRRTSVARTFAAIHFSDSQRLHTPPPPIASGSKQEKCVAKPGTYGNVEVQGSWRGIVSGFSEPQAAGCAWFALSE